MTAPITPNGRTFWTDRRISLVVFALVIIVCGFEIIRFTTSIRNGHTLTESKQTLEIVRDVVDPGGKRYQQGQAQQAQVLAALGAQTRDANAVAVYCARSGGDVATIKHCVDEEFAKLHPEVATTTTTVP